MNLTQNILYRLHKSDMFKVVMRNVMAIAKKKRI